MRCTHLWDMACPHGLVSSVHTKTQRIWSNVRCVSCPGMETQKLQCVVRTQSSMNGSSVNMRDQRFLCLLQTQQFVSGSGEGISIGSINLIGVDLNFLNSCRVRSVEHWLE